MTGIEDLERREELTPEHVTTPWIEREGREGSDDGVVALVVAEIALEAQSETR